MRRPSDGEWMILAEIDRDARQAKEGWNGCTACGGGLPEGIEADAFETVEGEYHRVCGPCALATATGATNQVDVPEARGYRREVIEGGTLVTYEVRQPDESAWTPVRPSRPDPSPPAEASPVAGWVRCPRCGERVPVGALRDGDCRLADLAAGRPPPRPDSPRLRPGRCHSRRYHSRRHVTVASRIS